MANFVKVAQTSEIPVGQGKCVEVEVPAAVGEIGEKAQEPLIQLIRLATNFSINTIFLKQALRVCAELGDVMTVLP